MSYMVVHKVPPDGEIETIGEFKNSWLGAMLIWNTLSKRYLGLDGAPIMGGPALQRLWDLAGDRAVPFQIRLVHGSTMDKVMVRRENLERLADAMDFFAETLCPDNSGHLRPHAELLREAAKDETLLAVCWTQTSVSDGVWKVWVEEEEESRWYDLARDEGHWFLFDEVKP